MTQGLDQGQVTQNSEVSSGKDLNGIHATPSTWIDAVGRIVTFFEGLGLKVGSCTGEGDAAGS